MNTPSSIAQRRVPRDELLREAEAQRALAELFPHLKIDALRAIQELFPQVDRGQMKQTATH